LRGRTKILLVLGTVAFVAISYGLARWLTTESRERQAILEVLEAQAKGDPKGMLEKLAPSCSTDTRCRAIVESNARRLRRAGEPKILNLQSKTSYALGDSTGVTRVAWTVVNNGLPVVQCVVVHRGGSVFAGRFVSLLRVSAPIGNESTC